MILFSFFQLYIFKSVIYSSHLSSMSSFKQKTSSRSEKSKAVKIVLDKEDTDASPKSGEEMAEEDASKLPDLNDINQLSEGAQLDMRDLQDVNARQMKEARVRESSSPSPAEGARLEKYKNLEKEMKKWQMDQIAKGKPDRMNFDTEVFSILAGKSSELQWFMFETRIRQVVSELLEPLQDRQCIVLESFQVQNGEFHIMKRRLEELEFVIQKVQRQSNQFDDLKHETDKFRAELRNQVNAIRNELNLNVGRINQQDESVKLCVTRVEKVQTNVEEMKNKFVEMVREAQDFNNESQKMAISIKTDVMAMLSAFKRRMEDYDRVAVEVKRLNSSMQEAFKKQDVSIEKAKRLTHANFESLSGRLDESDKFMKQRFAGTTKDLDFLKSEAQAQAQKAKQLEFYMNKIQPVKEFSSTCNLLHQVLRGKAEYNNLVEYEQKWYENLKNTLAMTKFTEEDLKGMVIEIPDKPVLERAKTAVKVEGYGQCDLGTVDGMLTGNLVEQFRTSLTDLESLNNITRNAPNNAAPVVGTVDTNRSSNRRAPVLGMSLPSFELPGMQLEPEKQQEMMADQLKGMRRKIEMEQKLQVAVPPQTKDTGVTLLDKLTLNNCTYFLTEISQKKRNRVTILCELLGDVKHIAQYNIDKYAQVIQRREIDELLVEQKKLDQMRKMTRDLQDKMERQLAESGRTKKVPKKPSKAGSKLEAGASDRRGKERDKKNLSKLSAATQQKSAPPVPSQSLQVASLSSDTKKKQSKQITGKPSSPSREKRTPPNQSNAGPSAVSKISSKDVKKAEYARQKSGHKGKVPMITPIAEVEQENFASLDPSEAVTAQVPQKTKQEAKAAPAISQAMNDYKQDPPRLQYMTPPAQADSDALQQQRQLLTPQNEPAKAGQAMVQNFDPKASPPASPGTVTEQEVDPAQLRSISKQDIQVESNNNELAVPSSEQKVTQETIKDGAESQVSSADEDSFDVFAKQPRSQPGETGENSDSDEDSDDESDDDPVGEKYVQHLMKELKDEIIEQVEHLTSQVTSEKYELIMAELNERMRAFDEVTIPGFKDMMADSDQMFARQTADFRSEVTYLQSELKEAFSLLDAAHNKALRERSDLMDNFKNIREVTHDANCRLENMAKNFSRMLKFTEQLFRSEELKFHLDYFDELDREQVALFGATDKDINLKGASGSPIRGELNRDIAASLVSDRNQANPLLADPKSILSQRTDDFNRVKKNPGSPPRKDNNALSIQVQPNCVSCSGQVTFIKKAFKMACLSYQPSTIAWRGEQLSRTQILKKRKLRIDAGQDILERMLQDQLNSHGHQTLEDTDIAITLDTNVEFYNKLEGSNNILNMRIPVTSTASMDPKNTTAVSNFDLNMTDPNIQHFKAKSSIDHGTIQGDITGRRGSQGSSQVVLNKLMVAQVQSKADPRQHGNTPTVDDLFNHRISELKNASSHNRAKSSLAGAANPKNQRDSRNNLPDIGQTTQHRRSDSRGNAVFTPGSAQFQVKDKFSSQNQKLVNKSMQFQNMSQNIKFSSLGAKEYLEQKIKDKDFHLRASLQTPIYRAATESNSSPPMERFRYSNIKTQALQEMQEQMKTNNDLTHLMANQRKLNSRNVQISSSVYNHQDPTVFDGKVNPLDLVNATLASTKYANNSRNVATPKTGGVTTDVSHRFDAKFEAANKSPPEPKKVQPVVPVFPIVAIGIDVKATKNAQSSMLPKMQ